MHAQARGRADRVGPRLAQHWWAWRALIGPLSTRYRVICPDIRGLGWSEGPARGYGLHRLAEDLIGLLDALGIERAQLLGHDWGTAVGYQAGLNRPERFSRFLALGGLTLWSSAGAPPRLFLRQWHIPALGLLGHYATTRLGISETRYGAGAMPGGSRARRSRPTRSPCVERCPRTPLSSTTAPRLRTLLAEERPEVVLERMTAFFGE